MWAADGDTSLSRQRERFAHLSQDKEQKQAERTGPGSVVYGWSLSGWRRKWRGSGFSIREKKKR